MAWLRRGGARRSAVYVLKFSKIEWRKTEAFTRKEAGLWWSCRRPVYYHRLPYSNRPATGTAKSALCNNAAMPPADCAIVALAYFSGRTSSDLKRTSLDLKTAYGSLLSCSCTCCYYYPQTGLEFSRFFSKVAPRLSLLSNTGPLFEGQLKIIHCVASYRLL